MLVSEVVRRDRNSLSDMILSRGTLVAISTIAKMATRAGIFLIIAPILGPTDQGTLVVMGAYAAVIGLLFAYAMQVKVLREIPAAPHATCAILMSDLLAMAALVLPTVVAALLVGHQLVPRDAWHVFALVFAATLATIVSDYLAAALRAFDSYRMETGVAVASAILQFATVVATGLIFRDLLPVAIALFASRVLVLVLSAVTVFSRSAVMASTERAPRPVGATIRQGWPYFVDGSLSVIAAQADILILSHLISTEAVGIYSAGSRLVVLALSFAWVVTNVMVPKIVRQTEPMARAREVRELRRVMLAGAAGGSLVLLFGGPYFTSHFLGPSYEELNSLWAFFALMFACLSLESYFSILMLATGRIRERALAQGLALAGIVLVGSFATWMLGPEGMILALSAVGLAKGIWFRIRLASDPAVATK